MAARSPSCSTGPPTPPVQPDTPRVPRGKKGLPPFLSSEAQPFAPSVTPKIKEEKPPAPSVTPEIEEEPPTKTSRVPSSSPKRQPPQEASGSEQKQRPFCQVCGKVFISADHVRRHVSTVHHKERSHVCTTCGMKFGRKDHLDRHVTQVHTKDGRYKCDQCPFRAFSPDKLTVHQRVHSGERPFVCNCGAAFPRKDTLIKHKRTHRGEGPSREMAARSPSCSTGPPTPRAPSEAPRVTLDKKGLPPSSSFCSKARPSAQSITPESKEEPLTKRGRVPPLSSKKQRPQGASGSDENQRPFCQLCGKWFTRASTMRAHIRTVHHKERNHVCTTCGMTFGHKGNLNKHVTQVHTKDGRYKCDQCPHRTVSQARLTVHQRKHSGERPFECQICGAAFPRKDTLNKHVNDMHDWQQRFSCETCSKMFTHKCSLTAHIIMRCHFYTK